MIDQTLITELDEQRPSVPVSRLSRAEKDRLIQRGFYGLYRWYVARSQAQRNWNPDLSFDWRSFRKDHSPDLITILEGFYAVEQYAPDYTAELTRLVRQSYGRAQFTLRWGAEEEKHADLWRNCLLFSGKRQPAWIEQYTNDLRSTAWTAYRDEPIHSLLYTVLQERATQLNYLNLAMIARGASLKAQFVHDADPVLAKAAATIAVDEAAHYHFFLEGARLFLYYYPEETLAALGDILAEFVMPASTIIPNYSAFIKVLYDADIFGKRKYVRDVVEVALHNFGITDMKSVKAGLKERRRVPDIDGQMRDTTLFEEVNFTLVESFVRRLFARIGDYEAEAGLSDIDPTRFVPTTWG